MINLIKVHTIHVRRARGNKTLLIKQIAAAVLPLSAAADFRNGNHGFILAVFKKAHLQKAQVRGIGYYGYKPCLQGSIRVSVRGQAVPVIQLPGLYFMLLRLRPQLAVIGIVHRKAARAYTGKEIAPVNRIRTAEIGHYKVPAGGNFPGLRIPKKLQQLLVSRAFFRFVKAVIYRRLRSAHGAGLVTNAFYFKHPAALIQQYQLAKGYLPFHTYKAQAVNQKRLVQ